MRRVLVAMLACAACTPLGEPTSADDGIPPEAPPAPVEPDVPEEPDEAVDEQEEPESPIRPEPVACSGVPGRLLPPHPDLEVQLRVKGKRPTELGQPLELVASIRNASKTTSHPAVLSGDGSEMGWREPHVSYSGFVDTGDGCWQPLEPLSTKRCGMFDENWQDEVVDLAPGGSRTLEWLSSPATSLDIHQAGRVRIYLHYAYQAGAAQKGGASTASPDVGGMDGVEPFELVSKPIEFNLRSTLKLELAAKAHRGRGNVSKISDLVTLRLENGSRKARTVAPPSANTLSFEVVGEETYHPAVRWQAGDEMLPKHRLAGGKSVPLLGDESPNPGVDAHWYPPTAEVVRIRASYQPSGQPGAPALRSEWVEIDLR